MYGIFYERNRHFEGTGYRAGLGVWGVINLLEGYGNDNPGANAHV